MRLTTRTPPVRIAAADMVAIAALPAEHAGFVLKWGMRRYATGMGVPLAEAREEAGMDQRSWAVLIHLVRPMLDAEALAAGTIVVSAFAQAADNLAKVSAAKVREVSSLKAVRAIAFAAEKASGGAQVEDARSAPQPRPASTRPTPPADAGPWEGVAGELVRRGSPAAEVEAAVARWRVAHAVEDVVSSLQSIAGRRISKPVRYLETMLNNAANARRSAMPAPVRDATGGTLLPRPVKRRIKVGPRAGWTFEGWTAKGHQRGGPEVQDRRQVWRNDSGGLSYKSPDPDGNDTVPTYEEDPGVYEAD